MAKQDYYEMVRATMGGGGRALTPEVLDQVTIRMSSPGKDGKQSVGMRIGANVLKQASMKPGDRVTVIYDTEGKSGVIKASDKGWRLSKGDERFSGIGFRWLEGMFRVNKPTTVTHKATKGQIAFTL